MFRWKYRRKVVRILSEEIFQMLKRQEICLDEQVKPDRKNPNASAAYVITLIDPGSHILDVIV